MEGRIKLPKLSSIHCASVSSEFLIDLWWPLLSLPFRVTKEEAYGNNCVLRGLSFFIIYLFILIIFFLTLL